MNRRSEQVRAQGEDTPLRASLRPLMLTVGMTATGKAAMQAAVRSSLTPCAQEWPTVQSVAPPWSPAPLTIPKLWPKMPASFYRLVPELDR